MMQPIHKKRNRTIVITLMILVSVFVLNIGGVSSFAREVITRITAPFVSQGNVLGQSFGSMTSFVGDIREARADQQKLRNENRMLKARVAQYDAVQSENERLRRDLDLLPRQEFNLVGAEVIARDPFGGGQWIMINRGSEEGLVEQSSVIAGESVLVGFVSEVFDRQARVRLITHPDSVIPVMHVQSQREVLAYGDHGIGINVPNIPRDATLAVGEIFVTIGLADTRIVDQLAVGTLQNIEESVDHLVQNAYLVPLFDTRDLHEVYVIKQ